VFLPQPYFRAGGNDVTYEGNRGGRGELDREKVGGWRWALFKKSYHPGARYLPGSGAHTQKGTGRATWWKGEGYQYLTF